MTRPTRLLALPLVLAAAPAVALAQGADDCANAQVISGFGPFAFDNTTATNTLGLADCDGLPARKDVWYRWTAPNDARVTVDPCSGITLITRIVVYEGDCNNLVQLTCGVPPCPGVSEVTFETRAGMDYLIRIGSRSPGQTGSGTFTLVERIPILNPNNGSFYELVPVNTSWTLARDDASALEWEGRPGHLATFTDQAEVDWVVQNVQPNRPWIGLFQDTAHPSYSEPSGGWVWLDGSDATYTNWASGEPNNTAAGGGAEDYAEMFGSGKWNDAEDNHNNTFEYLVEFDAPIGSNYCMANPNSTGVIGTTSALGFDTVAANDITLVASDLPLNTFGFFITSMDQGFSANPGGSAGNLCLGGTISRFQLLVQNTGSAGEFSIQPDLNAFPNPNGAPIAVQPGDTWNFQAWHRDSDMGNATSNFTEGLEILFR